MFAINSGTVYICVLWLWKWNFHQAMVNFLASFEAILKDLVSEVQSFGPAAESQTLFWCKLTDEILFM